MKAFEAYKNLFLKVVWIAFASSLILSCGSPSSTEIEGVDGVQYKSVELNAVLQRTQRFDCNANLVSDQWEKLKAPMHNFKFPLAKPSAVWRSQYYNKTTDSFAQSISNHSVFSIDYNFDWRSMHVAKGMNQIEYKLLYCSQPVDSDEDCPSVQSVQNGNFYLKIFYAETRKADVRKIYPSTEQCENQ